MTVLGYHSDFSELTINPADSRVFLTRREFRKASKKEYEILKPSSMNTAILIALDRQYLTNTRMILVKISGAGESPKGKIVKIKYF